MVGAGAGAASTAAAGGDPGQGALFGAVTGGATAGLTPAVSDVTGLGADASKAIASGISTTGAAAGVLGEPIGQALETGAVAGAGNYLGSQAVGALNSAAAPSTATPSSSDIQPVTGHA